MAFVMLNAYPGVGKATIGRIVAERLPNATLLTNHLLIDAAAALYDRSDPAYHPLRFALRSAVYASLESTFRDQSTGTNAAPPRLIIFTCQHFSGKQGASVMLEHLDSARRIGIPLISIVLSCDPEENARRMADRASEVRYGSNKLTDLAILREIRESEDLYEYGDLADCEALLDVTSLAPEEAAQRVVGIIQGALAERRTQE